MKTQLNGKDAPWPTEVWEKWLETMRSPGAPKKNPSQANYFEPRPYVDQYNRGSRAEGFTYVVSGEDGENQVWQSIINQGGRMKRMALAVEYRDGQVRYLSDETPEPWDDILERAGESVEAGATVTLARVRGWMDDHGRELFKAFTEWMEEPGSGVIPIKHTDWYVVGHGLDTRTERDPDEWRDSEEDL